MKKISIALATYNGEKYLNEQLESIASQSILPDELIVCDDCSTDKTIEILHNFKEKVSFEVKILKNDNNQGYIKNFAKVISETSGDYIFMCDQDDFWFPNKIEIVLKTFKGNPNIQLIAHNAIIADSDLKSTEITLFNSDREISSIVNGCVTCLRRDFLYSVLPIPDCYEFDSWFTTVANILNLRYNLNIVLSYYRRHDKAVTIDAVGKNTGIFNLIRLKIKKNINSLFNSRTKQYMDYRYNKILALLNYCLKIRNYKPPFFVDLKQLDKSIEDLSKIKVAFEKRYEAIAQKGFLRLNKILFAYKMGAYNYFHSYKTAIDDLLRQY